MDRRRWLAIATSYAGSAFDFSTEIWLFDTDSWQLVRTWPAHDTLVTSLIFSFDSEMLVSKDATGRIRFWDPEIGKRRMEITDNDDRSGNLILARDNSLLIDIVSAKVETKDSRVQVFRAPRLRD